jgi:hypothetical protein
LLPELLPFICQTDAFFDHAVGTSAGSLSPRTNWTSLADFEFALPVYRIQHRRSLRPRPARRPIKAVPANTVQEPQASYGPSPKGIGWRYAAPCRVPRQIQEVLVEPWLRDALIRLNPEIAAQPDRADEVLYKLRAIVLSVRSDGLIRANEE